VPLTGGGISSHSHSFVVGRKAAAFAQGLTAGRWIKTRCDKLASEVVRKLMTYLHSKVSLWTACDFVYVHHTD